MADEGLVGVVQERVDLAKRIGVVNHENKLRIHASATGGTGNHVAR